VFIQEIQYFKKATSLSETPRKKFLGTWLIQHKRLPTALELNRKSIDKRFFRMIAPIFLSELNRKKRSKQLSSALRQHGKSQYCI